MVAEKPSIAKDISYHLSSNNYDSNLIRSPSQYNKNFVFQYQIREETIEMVVTSVTGHIE